VATKTMSVADDVVLNAITEILSQARDREPGTFTMVELAEYLGCCVATAQKKLKPLFANGTIESVRVPITDMAGRRTTTCGYRYVVNSSPD